MRDRPAVALVVAAIAAAIFVVARRHRPAHVDAPVEEASAPVASTTPIPRPDEAVVELGVLTEANEAELEPFRDPKRVAALLDESECGDALVVVRAFVARSVALDVMPSTFWPMPSFEDLPDVTRSLTDDERARLGRPLRLVSVRASGPATSDQLPARAGYAAAIAIARVTGGLVYDRVDDRIESADVFATHAIIARIGASAFRADRIEIRYMARADGNVRLVTSGLLRFGAADVDVASVAPRFAAPLADLLASVAHALADGAGQSPVDVDLAGTKVRVDVVEAHPESGDPNRVMARIVVDGESTPAAYAHLASRLPNGPPTPTDDELDASRLRTQGALAGVLTRYAVERDAGAKLYVQLPFAYTTDAGEAGEEWMWIDVTRWDGATLDGTLLDTPENPVEARPGDTVHGHRSEATAFQLRGSDGGVSGSQ